MAAWLVQGAAALSVQQASVRGLGLDVSLFAPALPWPISSFGVLRMPHTSADGDVRQRVVAIQHGN